MPTMSTDTLVACPHCDTLHGESVLAPGEKAYCNRCHAVIMSNAPGAFLRILALAVTAFILMLAAVSFPFLDLDVQGNHNATSVVGAVLAFNDGLAVPLAIAVAFFIIILPLTRLAAIIYVIGPLVRGAQPHPGARAMYRLAEKLRPWAMGEIFMVGVTVALIKVAGIATVTIGPAFWAFAGLVVITILKDQMMCRYTIWQALDS